MYFYDDPLLESDCAWCGTKFSNNSHILWECERVKMFWEEYFEHANKANFSDRSDFNQTVMYAGELESCFKADRAKVMSHDDRTHLIIQAKSYLMVCHRIGLLPLHSEHWWQMMARRNWRMIKLIDSPISSHEGKKGISKVHMKWLKCHFPLGEVCFFLSLDLTENH